MTNTTDLLSTGIEIVAIFGFIVWRQLATRRVREGSRTPLILGAIGLLMITQYDVAHPISAAMLGALALGLAYSALMAFPRAASLRLWRDENGTLMRSGTWATAAWWIAVVAGRIVLGTVVSRFLGVPAGDASSFASVSVLLSLATTLGVQQALLLRRARTLALTPAYAA